MKRYIRTKDGKIFDFKKVWIKTIWEEWEQKEIERLNDEFIKDNRLTVIKQADTIEELIEVGDLVKIGNGLFEVDEFHLEYKEDFEITELYTKQGRNYVLVWTKEEGVI